ncbi:MAG: hypothetical protein ABSG99_08440 [Sedimentisphaerales bacterium]
MTRLSQIYKEFEISINEVYKHINIANSSLGCTICGQAMQKKYISNVYERLFLQAFTAWEWFLECIFIAYMTGAGTKRIKPKTYLKKIDKKRALGLLTGTLEYPDWTKIDDVRKLAELYFVGGRPFFLPLSEIETHFNEMKKVRNAIVHISSNSKDKFYGLVRAKLPAYSQDMTPGEFLMSPIVKGKTETFLDNYILFLKIAANKILPNRGI